MKFFLCSLAVALALLQISVAWDGENLKHDYEWGEKGPNDKLVRRTEHHGRPSGYGVPAYERVFYSNYVSGPKITYIRVIDHFTDGTGGFSRILYGGVGDYEVMLELRSAKSTPFQFTVEVYAWPDDV